MSDELRDRIADELAGHQIGAGYYATSVDGDTLTYEEPVRDEGGNKTLDGSGYRKRTRTYRLHPAEPIEEPA